MRMAYFLRSSRFSGLNKTLNPFISGPIHQHKDFVRSKHIISDFLFSSSDSSCKQYMCQLGLDPPYPIKHAHMQFDNEVAWRDPEEKWADQRCSIIASSGGLVLIYSGSCRSYCVFNPITTEFQLVPSNVAESSVGLAVDSIGDDGENNSLRYQVRLVGFFAWINKSKEKVMLKFTTFGFDSSQYWKENIDPQEFSYTSILRGEDRPGEPIWPDWRHAPVYLHGCMFWLLDRGNILSFDLEKCRATIIDGPWDDGWIHWFGQVQGSLSLCISDNISESDEYVIYAYDHLYTKTWQKRCKIRRPHGEYCYVAVFDGERLFMESYEKASPAGDMLIYYTSTKEWKNIGRMPNCITFHWRCFIPFVPTLAKPYSGLYLNCQESQNKLSNNIRCILNSIHQLLSSRNIDDFHS